MNLDDAVLAGMRNQVGQLRHLAVHTAGGRIEETDDYLFFAGAHAVPGTYTNGAIRKAPGIGAIELLARADEFFGQLGRAYYLWAEQHFDDDLYTTARRRGFFARPPESGNPCIVRTDRTAPLPEPEAFTIEFAHNDEQRREYLQVIARNYDLEGMPEELAEAVLFSIESLRSERVCVILARGRADGLVRGGISTFLSGDCVGLEWAATDPVTRGHGIGSALIEKAANWGFDQGAQCAWGVASQLGVPIWRKLGYHVPTHYRRLLSPPA